jgi:ferric-dicitrate binding protein FerR (iron transport regulator)
MTDDREPVSERRVADSTRHPSKPAVPTDAGRDARRAWGRLDSSIPPTENSIASSGSARVALIALGLAVAAAALLTLGFRADSQLNYELRGGRAQDGLIVAERGEATVALSDGSSILAENRTKFSVDVVGRHAALARLVTGKLHVRVAHNDDTRYRFLVGPYEVRVVGTEFDLAWEPHGAGLALSMVRGEVRFVEPGGKLSTLKAGEALRLPGLARSGAPTAAEPAPAVSADAAAAARAVPEPQTRATWDALVAKGQFADVVREAQSLGLDSVTERRSASDLKALGQAARYVGQRALSQRAFSALRERHRGTDAARQAAFFLGRLQEEQGHQAEALSWLDTYVAEAPRGVYAAEAYGRRLSLTERLRGPAAALPLAREYLERFPEGAYAPSARALVEHR